MRAVPLVDVHVDNQDTADETLGPEHADCRDDVVEDAEPASDVGERMVRAAAEVGGDAIGERGSGGEDRRACRTARPLDELRRPGQPQRELLPSLEAPVTDAFDPVGGVRPTEVVPTRCVRVVHVDAVEALRLLAHHAVLAEREAVPLGERIRVHVVREGAHCVPR
jgi:hypothetical protein